MSPVWTVLLLTSISGLAMPAGALIAKTERICPDWLGMQLRDAVIALGGGVLLSAVALVLVPEGIEHLALPWVVALFTSGGVGLMLLNRLLARTQTSASQLIAMIADFVPEALALGAAFAMGESTGLLLAILITFQNLPEGFNVYRELNQSNDISGRRIILTLLALAPLGPMAGLAGYFWLVDVPAVVGGIMLFAGGGILYLTFQDIAPESKECGQHIPALAAVLGLLGGLVGHILVMA